MFVIKADGSREEFDRRKIVNTCMRSGVGRKTSESIAEKISAQVSEGTGTRAIYRMILSELEKISDKSSSLFRLREAIAKIDPESYELYAKKILEAHGYKCEWNVLIKGEYVEHQVDVIAKKGNKTYLVECKKHTNPHRFCGLGVVLQVFARLESIQDGYRKGLSKYNFTGAWIFNNTKFSEHAKKYASGKKILLTGWKYSGKISLEKLIDSKNIYPVTILKCSSELQREMLKHRIITIHDMLSAGKKLLARIGVSDDIIKQARVLIS